MPRENDPWPLPPNRRDAPIPENAQPVMEPLDMPEREEPREWDSIADYAQARRDYDEGQGPDPGAYQPPKGSRPSVVSDHDDNFHQRVSDPSDPFAGQADDPRHNVPTVDPGDPFAGQADDPRHERPQEPAEGQAGGEVAELLGQLLDATQKATEASEATTAAIEKLGTQLAAKLDEVKTAIDNIEPGLT